MSDVTNAGCECNGRGMPHRTGCPRPASEPATMVFDQTIVRRRAEWRKEDLVVSYNDACPDTPWRVAANLGGTDGGGTEVRYRHRSDLESDIRDLQSLLALWNSAAIHISESEQ